MGCGGLPTIVVANAVVRVLAYGRNHRRVRVVCPRISWSAHSEFLRFAAVGARSNATSGKRRRPQPSETCVTSEQIRRYDIELKNMREAQRVLRHLGSQMLAFAESETAGCIAIKPFGFDPSIAGRSLIDLSNTLDRCGTDRAAFCKKVGEALRFKS